MSSVKAVVEKGKRSEVTKGATLPMVGELQTAYGRKHHGVQLSK